jgi:hypothetical protein
VEEEGGLENSLDRCLLEDNVRQVVVHRSLVKGVCLARLADILDTQLAVDGEVGLE